GISKSYGLKFSGEKFVNAPINRFIFYFVPLCSFGYMVSGGPDQFLGIPIITPTLAPVYRNALLALSLAATIYWVFVGTRAFLQHKLSPQYYGYMLTHFVIYLVSYVVITEINYSWLTINIWHN